MSFGHKRPLPPPDGLEVLALGGQDEFGRNTWILRSARGLIVLDAGSGFPEEEHLGLRTEVPDPRFLVEHADEVLGIFLSHGHEDHIGGVASLLAALGEREVPLYATPFTAALLEGKLVEADVPALIHEIDPGGQVAVGPFQVHFVPVTHSIPDACALAIGTPAGQVLYTGDFKLDPAPVDGRLSDLGALRRFAQAGVALMLSDSTNAVRPGRTPSESTVGPALAQVLGQSSGRVFVASFARNAHRVRQVLAAALQEGRKAALFGRSLRTVGDIAQEQRLWPREASALIPLEAWKALPPRQAVGVVTGAQGEAEAALARMAAGTHPQITLVPGDTVVFSATAIPGNEPAVHRLILELSEAGAKVLTADPGTGLHASGHGSAEELKELIALVQPRRFIPIHGEGRHLEVHAQLAQEAGLAPEQVLRLRNGEVLALSAHGGAEPMGQVHVGRRFVDGTSVLSPEEAQPLLKARGQLAMAGVAAVSLPLDRKGRPAGPLHLTHGGVWTGKLGPQAFKQAQSKAEAAVHTWRRRGEGDLVQLQGMIVEAVGRALAERGRPRPMVLVSFPVVEG